MSVYKNKPKELEGVPDIDPGCDMCENFEPFDHFPGTNKPRCKYRCGADCVTVLKDNRWHIYCRRYKGQETIL